MLIKVGLIIYGEQPTNRQHAFYQAPRDKLVYCDFIVMDVNHNLLNDYYS
ncbi:MAG: hypothetical protein ACSLEL_00865 [Candidatus Malihini olakiniferum]